LSANTSSTGMGSLAMLADQTSSSLIILPILSRNCGKRCYCFENLPVGVCIMFSAIAAPTWLMPSGVSGYQLDLA
jgi:hypothetical protein